MDQTCLRKGIWKHSISGSLKQESKLAKEIKKPTEWRIEVPLTNDFRLASKNKGSVACFILAFTKGEARAIVKKKFNLCRLPVGTKIREWYRGS